MKIIESRAPSIRILVIDDPSLIREGVSALVRAQSDMVLVGDVTGGAEGLDAFRAHRPDVTLLDVQMRASDGADLISALRRDSPDARIVALADREGDVPATRALRAGAAAYLLKSAPSKELLEAIRAVHGGRRHISSSVAVNLARYLTDDHLTPRELQVLKHVASGEFDHRIAARLCLSVETVKAHMKHTRSKLGATSRTHAVSIAFQRGIFDL